MPDPVAIGLAELTWPVEFLAWREIVAGRGRRCLVEKAAGANFACSNRVLAVPRHPFHKQVCKLSIDAFLLSFGSPFVWANVIIRKLPGGIFCASSSKTAGFVAKSKGRPAMLPGAVLSIGDVVVTANGEIGSASHMGAPFVLALGLAANLAEFAQRPA